MSQRAGVALALTPNFAETLPKLMYYYGKIYDSACE